MPALVITQVGDPDLGLIRAVAGGRPVAVAPGLLAAVRQRCEQARQALRGQPVYGVNTGMGALSSVRLTEQQQRSHQRNLLLARAAGGPPWLGETDARAIVAVRLLTFLTGDAAVSDGPWRAWVSGPDRILGVLCFIAVGVLRFRRTALNENRRQQHERRHLEEFALPVLE